MKSQLFIASAACAMLLAACGDDNTTTVNETVGLDIIPSGEKLGDCTADNDGEMVYVTDSARAYYCAEGEWKGAWAHAADTTDIADTTEEKISLDCDDAMFCGPKATEARVQTGFDDGSKKSGLWFDYTDEELEEGTSTITYAVKKGKNDSFDPIVAECDGICATVKLEPAKDETAFAGVGFNLVNASADGADLTTIGSGLCVAYTKTGSATLKVKLVAEDEANTTAYDDPYYTLPDASTLSVVEIPWAKFKMDGWGVNAKVTKVADAEKIVASIRFQAQSEDETESEFVIYAVGATGTCDGSAASSSSIAYGTLTDERDGQTYKTIEINGTAWMAENLNYMAENSKCYENANMCDEYGRLYTWADAQSACPEGWHVPTMAEWAEYNFVENAKTLAAGLCNSDGTCTDQDSIGYFWSSEYYDEMAGKAETFAYDTKEFSAGVVYREAAASVRCVEGPATCVNAMFCGETATESRVNTGFDDGENTSGNWYDIAEGYSTIVYPTEKGEDGSFDPIVKECKGVCASVALSPTESSAPGDDFAIFAFNLVNDNKTGADITKIGTGLCVTYKKSGSAALQVVLAAEDEGNTTVYDNPYYTLDATSEATTVEIPWDDFKMDGFGKSMGATVTTVAKAEKMVASIRFRVNTSATSSTVNAGVSIYAIGASGTCN